MGVANELCPQGAGVRATIWQESKSKLMRGVSGHCLGMNRLSIHCGGGGIAHKEKISAAQVRVFGRSFAQRFPVPDLVVREQRRIWARGHGEPGQDV